MVYLSTLMPKGVSHACESKTLISGQIMPADQFLTPDSQLQALNDPF